jgi:membrane protease YdiL (CAAX protease family)
MTDTQNKRAVIIEAFVLMIVLQGILELLEWLIAPSVPATRFASQMLSCALMSLLTVAVIIYARVRKQKLSVFPKAFSKFYIIATCITVLLLIVNPSNFSVGFAAVKSTVYFSIVTPIYEELLFRGYIWNRFGKAMDKKSAVYIWNIFLFALWHIGYMVPHIIEGNWFAVLTKLAAGAIFGVVLGFIRMRTDNCYITILAHGIMNLIGI